MRSADSTHGHAEMHERRTALWLVSVLAFLVLANIYDTSGALSLKYVAFFVACVSVLWTLPHFSLSLRATGAGLLLFVAWPTWSLLFGAARGGDLSVGVSQVTPFLFALLLALILPAFDDRLPLRLFYACLFSLAVVVIVSFTLVFLLPENAISQRIFETLASLHEREGYFGTRSWGEMDVPVFYFGSTLFLVPTFVYYLFSARIVRAGVVLLALGATFSKAGISIAVGFGAIYCLVALFSPLGSDSSAGPKTKWRRYLRASLPVLLLGAFVALLLLSFPGFFQEIQDTYSGESDTALVRRDHIHSLTGLFVRNPHYLLVGQGVGLSFFSSGEASNVQNIEVDHLNAVRKFGLPWFVAFPGAVFLTARRLIKAKQAELRASGFALVSMYFAAGTNPVLLTPLFIILIAFSYFARRPQIARPS
jgi:hypothetical protein